MKSPENMITPLTPPEEMPPWLKVEEVAAYWRVNRKTVYDMIQRKELKARKFGRVFRINRDLVIGYPPGNARDSRSSRSYR